MQEAEETALLLHGDSQPGGETRSQSSATTKVPEVEIHLFLTDRGMIPVDVFKWTLVRKGHLEVKAILYKYAIKKYFAFTVDEARGFCVPIRFNPKEYARSLLTYEDGTVVHIIAEPKNRVIEAIERQGLAAVFAWLLYTFLVSRPPAWIKNNFSIMDLPLWAVVCIFIVLMVVRMNRIAIYMKLGML